MTGRLFPSSRVTLLIALLVVALFLLPWVGGRYPVYLAIQVLILAVFSLGFNLLFGYTGLLSFGQAGFFAVGAYGCAKILLAVPNLLLGILGGVAAAGIAALLLGVLSVRHTRIYFSMLTLAFGMMIFSIAWKWRDFTGGDDGLVGIPRAPLEIPGLFSLSVAAMERYYYVVLVLSLLAIYAMYRLVRSPLGLTRSLSFGVVSCADRYLGDLKLHGGIPTGRFNTWIQTDASASEPASRRMEDALTAAITSGTFLSVRSPMTPPPSSRNISTACSGRTISESPMISKVGAWIASMVEAGKSLIPRSICVFLANSVAKSSGLGAIRRYSSCQGEPNIISGFMSPRPAMRPGGRPSSL